MYINAYIKYVYCGNPPKSNKLKATLMKAGDLGVA